MAEEFNYQNQQNADVQNAAQADKNLNSKKMKACKSCGAMISKNAKTCPNCGAKNKKPIYKRFWFILLVIALIAIIVAVIKGPKEYDFENPVATVTVDNILQDFKNNSTAAGEKYSDNVVAVTGKVYEVFDEYVTIQAYDDDLWLYNVNAYMNDNEDLKKFSVGETTTVVGVCSNTTLFGDVDIKQCVINEKFSAVPDYDNPIKTDIAELIKAYNDNQVSADEKYKYKTVELSATVSYVSDDYIVFEPDNIDAWDFDADMQVYFENNDDLAKVKEDKSITIIGECYGKGDIYTVKICRAIVK